MALPMKKSVMKTTQKSMKAKTIMKARAMNTRFLEFWQKKTSLGTFNLLEFLLSNSVLDEDIPIWWSLHVGYSLRYLECLFGGHENHWLVWEGCRFLRASPPKQKQFRTKTAMKARTMNAVWYLGPIQYKATPPRLAPWRRRQWARLHEASWQR